MTKCMSYQEGKIDSPFSLRNQGGILREHLRNSNLDATQIPFLCFLQEYKLFMRSLETSRETLSMNTEKASS